MGFATCTVVALRCYRWACQAVAANIAGMSAGFFYNSFFDYTD
jgi:hypothetical protein